MERSKFVSGELKPPRPTCSTDGCDGSVYHKTIKHCEDCIAKFNKSVEDSRPINVTPSTGMELPHIMTMEDLEAIQDSQNLRGEEYQTALSNYTESVTRLGATFEEAGRQIQEPPRPITSDFDFE